VVFPCCSGRAPLRVGVGLMGGMVPRNSHMRGY